MMRGEKESRVVCCKGWSKRDDALIPSYELA